MQRQVPTISDDSVHGGCGGSAVLRACWQATPPPERRQVAATQLTQLTANRPAQVPRRPACCLAGAPAALSASNSAYMMLSGLWKPLVPACREREATWEGNRALQLEAGKSRIRLMHQGTSAAGSALPAPTCSSVPALRLVCSLATAAPTAGWLMITPSSLVCAQLGHRSCG
jgi:hypothetical protein